MRTNPNWMLYSNGVFGRLPDGRTFHGHLAKDHGREIVIADAVLRADKRWQLVPKEAQFVVDEYE